MNRPFPTVNIRNYNFQSHDAAGLSRAIETIGDALTEFGFIAIDGHGISPDLLRNSYAYAESIFNLSAQEKLSYSQKTETGMPRGFAIFTPEASADHFIPGYKEAWHFGPNPLEKRQDLLNNTNIWPHANQQNRENVADIFAKMSETAMTILDACSLYLGKQPNYFRNMAEGDSLLRMLKYPAVPKDYKGHLIRTDAHEDLGMVTIMCEPTMGGLEFLTHDNQWIRVPNLEGKLILNVGEILADMTDDTFHSPIHRVTGANQREQSRMSLVAFIMPQYEASMGDLYQTKEHHKLSVKEYLSLKIPQLPSY